MKVALLKVYYSILVVKGAITKFYNELIKKLVQPPIVNSTDETLNKLLNERCSISRYGDGEFSLIYERDLLFQPYSLELSVRLKNILKSQQQNHIVGIPDVFKDVNWCTEKSRNYWERYLYRNRNKIYKILDMKKEYYDSLMTRLYVDHKDKDKAKERFEKLKKLWANRDILIVEGEQSRLGVGNDLFNNAHSIKRILCPPKNAFSKYDEILNLVLKHNKSTLILIALGPTATVLAYDLSINDYQAIDIGHVDIEYEWFLQKASEKLPVKNKYIGEIKNGTNVEDISDDKYESEIAKKIVL